MYEEVNTVVEASQVYTRLILRDEENFLKLFVFRLLRRPIVGQTLLKYSSS